MSPSSLTPLRELLAALGVTEQVLARVEDLDPVLGFGASLRPSPSVSSAYAWSSMSKSAASLT